MPECICGGWVTQDFYRVFSMDGVVWACGSCLNSSKRMEEMLYRKEMGEEETLKMLESEEQVGGRFGRLGGGYNG